MPPAKQGGLARRGARAQYSAAGLFAALGKHLVLHPGNFLAGLVVDVHPVVAGGPSLRRAQIDVEPSLSVRAIHPRCVPVRMPGIAIFMVLAHRDSDGFRRVGHVVETDPDPPPLVGAAGRYLWHSVLAIVAALVHDGRRLGPAQAGYRAGRRAIVGEYLFTVAAGEGMADAAQVPRARRLETLQGRRPASG